MIQSRLSQILLLSTLLFSCRHPEDSATRDQQQPFAKNPLATKPSAAEQQKNECQDARIVTKTCEDNMVQTHVGCSGGTYNVRCAPCLDLRATTCSPDSTPTVVPECGSNYKGTCVAKANDSSSTGKTLVCNAAPGKTTGKLKFTGVGSGNMEAQFEVVEGALKNKTFKSSSCDSEPGAIEASYICQIATSTDSGYEVRLASIGSSSLYGSVQAWTMSGKKAVENHGECN